MTDDTNTTTNPHNFKNLTEEKHKQLSAKGGRKKGLKGLAYLKKYDPKRFQEITSKGGATRKSKDPLPRDAGKHIRNV